MAGGVASLTAIKNKLMEAINYAGANGLFGPKSDDLAKTASREITRLDMAAYDGHSGYTVPGRPGTMTERQLEETKAKAFDDLAATLTKIAKSQTKTVKAARAKALADLAKHGADKVRANIPPEDPEPPRGGGEPTPDGPEATTPAADEGPKEGDHNADGLVFYDGRWHREEDGQDGGGEPPEGPEDLSTSDPEYPPSSPEELQKGQEAMEQVIAGKGDVDRPSAFERPGIGPISLYWGKVGTLPKNSFQESTGKEKAYGFKKGSGVAKIIAKRNWEGSDGEQAARTMIPTIALGDVGPVYGPEGGQRRDITHQGWQATISLFKDGDRETWLLTGFPEHEAPGEPEKVHHNIEPTLPGSTDIRSEEGAGANPNVIPPSGSSNPEPIDQDPKTLGPGDKITFDDGLGRVKEGTIFRKQNYTQGLTGKQFTGYEVYDEQGEKHTALTIQVKSVIERTSGQKREGGAFEDYGDKIGGARKDLAALRLKYDREGAGAVTLSDAEAMEEDPAFAAKMITRDNVLQPKETLRGLKENGMGPGAGFVLRRLMNAIPAKPEDSPAGRKLFMIGCNRVQEAFQNVTTAGQAKEAVGELLQELHGICISAEHQPMNATLKQAMLNTNAAFRDGLNAAKGERPSWHAIHAQAYMEVKDSGKTKSVEGLMKKTHSLAQGRYDAINRGRQARGDAWEKADEALELKAAAEQAKKDYQGFLLRMGDETASKPWNSSKGLTSLGAKLQETLGSSETAKSYNARSAISNRLHTLMRDAEDLDKKQDWSWFKDDAGPKDPAKPRQTKAKAPAWIREVPEQVEREGGESHSYEAKDLSGAFGLRGIEYGNWVNDDEAKAHTQAAGDALMDMAEVLGLDPKIVSLNGRVALAFGARGTGRALAHYEGATKAINLTKTSGGGSLGHEWGHALDNIMAQASYGDKQGHSSFCSEGEISPDAPPALIQAWKNLDTAMHVSKTSAGTITETIRGKSKFRNHAESDAILQQAGGDPRKAMALWMKGPGAAKIASGRRIAQRFGAEKATKQFKRDAAQQAQYFMQKAGETGLEHKAVSYLVPPMEPEAGGQSNYALTANTMGEYWKRPREMFARAFESFLNDELAAKGRKNTYLVAGTKAEGAHSYNHPTLAAHDIPTCVYPRGEERQAINQAMRELFEALKVTRSIEKALASPA